MPKIDGKTEKQIPYHSAAAMELRQGNRLLAKWMLIFFLMCKNVEEN